MSGKHSWQKRNEQIKRRRRTNGHHESKAKKVKDSGVEVIADGRILQRLYTDKDGNLCCSDCGILIYAQPPYIEHRDPGDESDHDK